MSGANMAPLKSVMETAKDSSVRETPKSLIQNGKNTPRACRKKDATRKQMAKE